MKTIGIVGSRRRDTTKDYGMCIKAFKKVYRKGDRIVSGGCKKGGDRFAEAIAIAYCIIPIIHLPDYKNKGKAATFIRNTKIAEDCDVLIAVVASDRTGGTEDTIKKVKKLGKKVILV